jgi:2,4-dienoyl-CoA reductase-like NADH-dependent reductase (Old Yellow Enzyme family)
MRVMDIVSAEILENDIKMVKTINRLIHQQGAAAQLQTPEREARQEPPYREIKLHVIRPDKDLGVDIREFKPADITKMIEAGRQAAKKGLI